MFIYIYLSWFSACRSMSVHMTLFGLSILGILILCAWNFCILALDVCVSKEWINDDDIPEAV